MALTIANKLFTTVGGRGAWSADVTFDSSYAYGGESFNPRTLFGIRRTDAVIVEPKDGYSIDFDRTNNKLKVLAPAPPIIWEEQQTIASNAITLNYPAAYIIYVAQANANIALTDPAATVAANQCQLTAAIAANTRTSLTFHSGLSGTVYVGYITQAWKEVFDNLVQSEAVTIKADAGALANVPVAIQSIRTVGTTSVNVAKLLDKDDTAATGEVGLTPTDGSVATANADVVTSLVATYIKQPSSGFLKQRTVSEESLTAGSNICTTAKPILMWGYCGQFLENGQVSSGIVNINGAAGSNEGYFYFAGGSQKLAYNSCTTGTGMYVWGFPWEIPNLMPLETPNGKDLSALTVRVFIIGN